MNSENLHRHDDIANHHDAGDRAQTAKHNCPFLSTAQAAHYVGLSRRTLEKMRSNGDGPEYRKHGRYVRYHIDDLDAWSTAHRKTSTASK
jgi:excisionase family DNA binding protein